MKKILLTLFAMMLVLGVSAANGNAARKKIARPAAVSNHSVSPKLMAHKVEAGETVDLNFTIYGNMNFYFQSYEDPTSWYFGDSDDSGKYMIRLQYNADEDGQFGTYTLSDLDPEYSYVTEFTEDLDQIDHALVEGTEFTFSKEENTIILTGHLVCDNGVTYALHGEMTPPTYDIEGTTLGRIAYYEDSHNWFVVFNNDDYKVRLNLVSPTGSFAGTYTQDDIYEDDAYIEDIYMYDEDYLSTLNVTMSIPEGYDDPNKACEITGTAVGFSGKTYNFHFKLEPPVEPKKVVDLAVNVESAQWPSIYGGSYYELSEKENPDEKWTLQYWNLTGEYSENGLNLQESKRYNSTTGDEQTVLYGTVSQTFDTEAMKILAKAELVMSDTIQYNINFEAPVETKGEISYSFTNLDLDNSYAAWGSREITASNDEAAIDVQINNADVPGEYTDKNLYMSIIVKDEEGYDNYINSLTIFNASTTIDDNGNAVFKARLLAEDMYIYNIEACFILPEVKDTLTVAIDGVNVTDYTQNGEEAAFYIDGSTEDGTSIYMGVKSTQIPGHYTIEDINEAVHGSNITFTDGDNTDKAVFYAGEFDVTQDGRLVTLTGDFQAGSHFVHLTLNGKTLIPNAIDYDNEDEGIDVSFTADDLVALAVTYDGVGVELQNEERNDVFETVFYLEDYDVETVPEGEYAVTGWGEVPGVAAGDNWGGYLSGTYYGTFDEEGYVNTPLWFLAYGTVTVTTNNGELAFEVNGQNSYYQPFHVAYNMPTNGISNTIADTVKTQKYMKGSNLVICKGGKEYNAVGQQMK